MDDLIDDDDQNGGSDDDQNGGDDDQNVQDIVQTTCVQNIIIDINVSIIDIILRKIINIVLC